MDIGGSLIFTLNSISIISHRCSSPLRLTIVYKFQLKNKLSARMNNLGNQCSFIFTKSVKILHHKLHSLRLGDLCAVPQQSEHARARQHISIMARSPSTLLPLVQLSFHLLHGRKIVPGHQQIETTMGYAQVYDGGQVRRSRDPSAADPHADDRISFSNRTALLSRRARGQHLIGEAVVSGMVLRLQVDDDLDIFR